jgi:hypothetical protein
MKPKNEMIESFEKAENDVDKLVFEVYLDVRDQLFRIANTIERRERRENNIKDINVNE